MVLARPLASGRAIPGLPPLSPGRACNVLYNPCMTETHGEDSLPPALRAAVAATAAEWDRDGRSARLWGRDASLWTSSGEDRWLGWLDAPAALRRDLDRLRAFRAAVAAERFTHAGLLGMGGSSLCPEVLRRTFGRVAGAPDLRVLDSTVPAEVRAFEQGLDLARTLFLVASKSGTTLEPTLFEAYFFARAAEHAGDAAPGSRFVAITDPGSVLDERATKARYRAVFHGEPSIGGRFSALSFFGMAPAAVIGLDVDRLAASAERMAAACAAGVPASRNPGVRLGIMLGVAARGGRDKVTLVLSPAIQGLGAWLEQLLAESTGKQGTGLLPIDGETLGPAGVYRDDRLFVHVRHDGAPDAEQDAALGRLAAAGHPVVRLSVADRYGIAGEFFRWEMATAVAGAVLGVNPFDQPDVEASKAATRKLAAEHAAGGGWPEAAPLARAPYPGGEILAYADGAGAAPLRAAIPSTRLDDLLAAHCARLRAGDYFAVLAYVERCARHEASLARLRHGVRDARRAATTVGFGPRFLHSTGQAHKGGPDSGVFLQVTCDDGDDLSVPGHPATFGVVKTAQARGDAAVLAERGRRALRLHLAGPAAPGLDALADLVRRAAAASAGGAGGPASEG